MTDSVQTSLFEHAEGGVETPAGTVLFREGDEGTTMYIVKSGEVELTVNGRVVEVVGTDGFFGEMAVIDPAPRSTTATVKSDAVIITMDQTRFMFMIRQTPFFSMAVMKSLIRRLRAMDQRL
jgi:CRP-like cAMP-binding protein